MSRVLPQKASSILAIPGTATASEPAVLCVALADDKVRTQALSELHGNACGSPLYSAVFMSSLGTDATSLSFMM